MPRTGRLDYPGALHHVLARGVARGKIFGDDRDRTRFLKDLATLVAEAKGGCLAWVLMPNHVHLLLRTGERPLRWIMHRLLMWYAQGYNRRWRRSGHLFQNRYKAILIEDDPYLGELVRYIHLNPLRSGLVSTLGQLAKYPWCGHGALVGIRSLPWQAVDEVLETFGGTRGVARERYLR